MKKISKRNKNIYALIFTAIILGISVLSISNKEDIISYSKGLFTRNRDLLNYQIFGEYDKNSLEKKLIEAKESIGMLIIRNHIYDSTEHGGESYLTNERIVFERIPSQTEDQIKYYNALKSGDASNLDSLINFVNTNYREIGGKHLEPILNSLMKIKRNQITASELPDELFQKMFKSVYIAKGGYPFDYQGKLLSRWHIHLDGSNPSKKDISNSSLYPELVISNLENGSFIVHYLFKNEHFQFMGHSKFLEKYLQSQEKLKTPYSLEKHASTSTGN